MQTVREIVEKFEKEMAELRAEYLAYYGQFIKENDSKESEENK